MVCNSLGVDGVVKFPEMLFFNIWTTALAKIIIVDNLIKKNIIQLVWCCTVVCLTVQGVYGSFATSLCGR